jgi:hypothetical protein
MAHFAQVSDGIVQQVIVVGNGDAPTEVAGKAFIASIGLAGEWVQTSYNSNLLKDKTEASMQVLVMFGMEASL